MRVRKIKLAPEIIFADLLTLEEARNARDDAVNSLAGKYYIFSVRTNASNDGTCELMGRNRELWHPFAMGNKSLIIEVRSDKVEEVAEEDIIEEIDILE